MCQGIEWFYESWNHLYACYHSKWDICVYDLKMAGELRAMTWTLHVDLLSHCVMYTLRPGNSTVLGKQQLKTKVHGAYQVNTQARQPFARIIIVNGNLLRSKVRIRQKYVICQLPHSVLKYTKECNPSNATKYCVLIIHELEYRRRLRIRRKRRNADNAFDIFHVLSHVHMEEWLALSVKWSELSPCQFYSSLLSPVER